jgi:hypothetical protein
MRPELSIACRRGTYCQMFPLRRLKYPEANFRRLQFPDCNGGRILFNKNRHGRYVTLHHAQSMTAAASTTYPPDGDDPFVVRQLRIGLAHYAAGAIKEAQTQGDIEGAEAAYAEAARIQPLIRRPATKLPAEFRVLALFAPFAGNTPTGFLFRDSVYDTDTLAVFAAREYDIELLRQDVQVVVNLISDADQADALLPLAADLVDRLGKPTVNDPPMIRKTTRDAVAGLLQGIPGCRIPKIWRQKAGTDFSIATLQAELPLPLAILARPVGTHGGDDFEKIDDPAELTVLLAQRPETDRYLIEYVDYRSSDGYFRKYRFIFVDAQILPYHLAIANDWKVHHGNTDMADHQWMQREEEAFLNDPAPIFSAGHYRILRAIRERIGLEYFGIDCGIDRSGDLVVFEVNASMLVHDGNEQFPYKTPFVLRIKSAFDQMLRNLAVEGTSQRRRYGGAK